MPHAAFASPIRSGDVTGLVSQWRAGDQTDASPLDLSRSWERDLHILVSDQHARADDSGRRAAGSAMERSHAMKVNPDFSALCESFFAKRLSPNARLASTPS